MDLAADALEQLVACDHANQTVQCGTISQHCIKCATRRVYSVFDVRAQRTRRGQRNVQAAWSHPVYHDHTAIHHAVENDDLADGPGRILCPYAARFTHTAHQRTFDRRNIVLLCAHVPHCTETLLQWSLLLSFYRLDPRVAEPH